ncbi:MAG: hypothetical protein WAW09_11080 [Smithella sp.]|jgi:hypothetical protein
MKIYICQVCGHQSRTVISTAIGNRSYRREAQITNRLLWFAVSDAYN